MIFSWPKPGDKHERTYFVLFPRRCCWMVGNVYAPTDLLDRHTVWLERVRELVIYGSNGRSSEDWNLVARFPIKFDSQLKILRQLEPKVAAEVISHFPQAVADKFTSACPDLTAEKPTRATLQ